jgi:hypothetical protein
MAPLSAVLVDGSGERIIVNYRDPRLAAARVADPAALIEGADAVLADNRFPEFILPICQAARDRGLPPIVSRFCHSFAARAATGRRIYPARRRYCTTQPAAGSLSIPW